MLSRLVPDFCHFQCITLCKGCCPGKPDHLSVVVVQLFVWRQLNCECFCLRLSCSASVSKVTGSIPSAATVSWRKIFGSLSLYFCQLCKVDLFLQAWFHLMVFITKRCRLLEFRARYFMSVTSHHLECHLHRYFHTVKLIAVAWLNLWMSVCFVICYTVTHLAPHKVSRNQTVFSPVPATW